MKSILGRKLKTTLVLLAALAAVFSFSACKTESSSDDDNTETEKKDDGNSVICPQYFWGKWTRMDNGAEYEITESNVKSSGTVYKITSKTDSSFTCALGTFTKDTDNVLLIGTATPVFRNGGSNIPYSVTVVGFSDSEARAATAGKTAKGLGGVSVTAKSGVNSSDIQEKTTDTEGKAGFTASVAGDEITISASSSDGTTVTTTKTPKYAGENAGTIAIPTAGRYSLSVTGEITSDTAEDDGYLYAGKTYAMTVKVQNTTDIRTRPGNVKISSSDSRVNVSGKTSGDIPSFTSGVQEYQISVSCSSLDAPYSDTGIDVTFEDADGYVWSDYIPLKFYKEKETIQIYAEGVSNDECALNGFVMFPDGKSKYFSVASGGTKNILVPSFPETEPYKLAFSGAVTGKEISESTEMRYSVGVNVSAVNNFSSDEYNVSKLANTYEPNENENQAVEIGLSSAAVSYLETGDIDFYKVAVNSFGSKAEYKVNHYLEPVNRNNAELYQYELSKSETLVGIVGGETIAADIGYKGFTANKFNQETIKADGSTSVRIYYKRNSVTLTFNYGNGEDGAAFNYADSGVSCRDTSGSHQTKGPYGNAIWHSGAARTGYIFKGWNVNGTITALPETYPVEDTVYTAVWEENKEILSAIEKIEHLEEGENLSLSLSCKIDRLDIVNISYNKCIRNAIKNTKGNVTLDLRNVDGDCGELNFNGCEKLVSITIPNCISQIPEAAFAYCSGLTSVIIPKNVTNIDKGAFYSCKNLSSVKFDVASGWYYSTEWSAFDPATQPNRPKIYSVSFFENDKTAASNLISSYYSNYVFCRK